MGDTPTEKVAIRSSDGVLSRLTVYRAGRRDASVVICLPAMGVKASYYGPLARALVKGGRNCITADLRGHGESGARPARGTDFGYGEMVKCDWPAVISRSKALFPEAPTVILGHSLGGQLSTLYMSEHPEQVRALIMVAAPSLYYRNWSFPRSLWLLYSTQLFRWVSALLGYFPGRRMGVGGTEAAGVARDWARVVRKGRYDMIDPAHDYVELLKGLRMPLLAMSFSDDEFAPRRAVDGLCATMTGVDLTRWHITTEEMGCKTLGHFAWVKESEKLADKMSEWLVGLGL
ncbi:MAG: alpha/beta fold hydrolase [Deltaproteobacteria bacterium]|nr:alpha/beta fold hydrolase [Deltaproteobacteria bacterium]MBW1819878.1 alpha/beta fold hydrolase [Deltaproteobacteria bacterium]